MEAGPVLRGDSSWWGAGTPRAAAAGSRGPGGTKHGSGALSDPEGKEVAFPFCMCSVLSDSL